MLDERHESLLATAWGIDYRKDIVVASKKWGLVRPNEVDLGC